MIPDPPTAEELERLRTPHPDQAALDDPDTSDGEPRKDEQQ